MHQSARSTLVQHFYPALNGLRAVAFLMVFVIHYCMSDRSVPVARWGWVGVDLFFVLSGFLITGILYDSLGQPNYFRNFYLKRSLRVFPLFYGFFLVMLIVTPVLHLEWNQYNLSTFAYLGNFFHAGGELGLHASPLEIHLTGISFHGIPAVISLGHFWSLCVEEQFYLVWPAIVFLIRKRSSLLRFCLLVIVVMPFLRALYFLRYPLLAANSGIYMNGFLRSDSLLVGAAIALWLRHTSVAPAQFRRYASIAACTGPLLIAAGCFAGWVPQANMCESLFISSIGYTFVAITAGGILLLSLDASTHLYRILQNRVLTGLGSISYGLYFYHYLPGQMLNATMTRLHPYHLAPLVPLIVLPCTVAIAWLSFKYIESPFLSLKQVLTAPKRAPVPQGALVRWRVTARSSSFGASPFKP